MVSSYRFIFAYDQLNQMNSLGAVANFPQLAKLGISCLPSDIAAYDKVLYVVCASGSYSPYNLLLFSIDNKTAIGNDDCITGLATFNNLSSC